MKIANFISQPGVIQSFDSSFSILVMLEASDTNEWPILIHSLRNDDAVELKADPYVKQSPARGRVPKVLLFCFVLFNFTFFPFFFFSGVRFFTDWIEGVG